MKRLFTLAFFGAITSAGVAQASEPEAVLVKYATTEYRNGKPFRVSLSELAVRADGSKSESRWVRSRDGKDYMQNTITDAATQRRVVVDGITESLTTYLLSTREWNSLKDLGARCASFSEPGKGVHLGFETSTVTDTNVPNRVLESSYAPDLGCVLLREVVRLTQGEADIVLMKEATSVELGEKTRARFTVPPWKERSPSSVLAEYERKFGLASLVTPRKAGSLRTKHTTPVRQ